MNGMNLACRVDERRKKLFGNADWNGLDYVEVSGDQLSLYVHFFGQVPENVTVRNVRIEGGRRIRDIKATKVDIDRSHDPEVDDQLRITLDKFGDFSTYRLWLVDAANADPAGEAKPMLGLDPRYSCLDFSFKADCANDLDCASTQPCPPEVFPAPHIDYLSKDYASFRQLIYDRLALTMPDWQERHVPDVGVTLVELLAYTADYLSYYQDAVATEAYLGTARQRISVRRHARLMDYRMHEGNNARAWVTVSTDTDLTLKAGEFYFITGFSGIKAGSGNLVKEEDLNGVPASWYEVFEPMAEKVDQEFVFRKAHSEMYFYTWGDSECCLPKGATRATLLNEERFAGSHGNGQTNANPDAESNDAPDSFLKLGVGDVLIFEEARSPTTSGLDNGVAYADPMHRHAVRLTKLIRAKDELLDKLVLEIEWAPEDALPFSLCLSARLPSPDCSLVSNVSVARGNVVLVDHGRRVVEDVQEVIETREVAGECACEGSITDSTLEEVRRINPVLKLFPITSAAPLQDTGPASTLLTQDPRSALPRILLQETTGSASSLDGGTRSSTGPVWTPKYDLLDSSGEDRNFVAEMDDEGRAHLRFGDGELGRMPRAGATFKAVYRAGNGPAGNVGRETISYIVRRKQPLSEGNVRNIRPRNPLPAEGGKDPEPVANVKLFAPQAFRGRLERAITAEDYIELASGNPKLQGAAAELRWMGSWYEARVAIDPAHTEEADQALLDETKGNLYRYRRIGHDLAVAPATYVPLDIGMEISVLPHYARGHVKAALLEVFSNRQLQNGGVEFFHPDNLRFGQGIYLSQLIAAAKAVEGVETASVYRLERLGMPNGDALKNGILPMGAWEVAQLDNDPSFPENGRLELKMGGGR
jgi:hypothetical protein